MPNPPAPISRKKRRQRRIPAPPPPVSWREKWQTGIRIGIRAGETATVLCFWIGGVTAGDMPIVYLLFAMGFVTSALALISDPVRSSTWKASIGLLMALLFTSSAVAIHYRHEALDNAAALAAPSPSRPHFSQTQTISNAGKMSGQSDELNLDNIATLKIFAPYSTENVTLVLDADPTYYPGYSNSQVDVLQTMIIHGDHKKYIFDKGANKRQVVQVGTRKFLVTLMDTGIPSKRILAVQIEYTFGISEE